jgi:hypothetical protein
VTRERQAAMFLFPMLLVLAILFGVAIIFTPDNLK